MFAMNSETLFEVYNDVLGRSMRIDMNVLLVRRIPGNHYLVRLSTIAHTRTHTSYVEPRSEHRLTADLLETMQVSNDLSLPTVAAGSQETYLEDKAARQAPCPLLLNDY
jgi:hypothetical protein